MARSMTFQINDASTSSTNPAVFITITENPDGTLNFSLTQAGGIVGDLRGLFFDVADESLIGTMKTNAGATNDFRQGDDNIKDLGDGSNMNGLTGSDKGYDAGVEIGTAGIGKDDYQSYSFTLSSSARALTLDDFANVNFGVRLTSVGTIDGSRDDSSKLLETTSAAINANADSATVNENATAGGNLLANDANTLAATSVTGWSGGALGAAVALDNAAGATLTVNADGSYSLDASAADALSAGEVLSYSFSYNATSASADQTSSDSASFTVTVIGQNDGPVAEDDSAGRINEDASLAGSVLGNDSDVDRLDTLTVSAVNGQAPGTVVTLASGATVTMNADGTYTYDTNGAFDALNTGESATDSFEYTISDGNGGFDTALVTVAIDGVGQVVEPPPPDPVDPALTYLFNHGTEEFDHGWFPQEKTNAIEGFTDNDIVMIAGYGNGSEINVTTEDYDADGNQDTVIEIDWTDKVQGADSTGTDYAYLLNYTGLEESNIRLTGFQGEIFIG